MTTQDQNRGVVDANGESAPNQAPIPGSGPTAASFDLLDAATRDLRNHVDDRWVEVRERVFLHAVSSPRRSRPVRAEAPGGQVRISEHILISALQDSLDTIVGLALEQVTFDLVDDQYQGVEILVVVQYGQRIIALADRARELAVQRLTELLGPITPPVTVTTMVVHVGDVTIEDPNSI